MADESISSQVKIRVDVQGRDQVQGLNTKLKSLEHSINRLNNLLGGEGNSLNAHIDRFNRIVDKASKGGMSTLTNSFNRSTRAIKEQAAAVQDLINKLNEVPRAAKKAQEAVNSVTTPTPTGGGGFGDTAGNLLPVIPGGTYAKLFLQQLTYIMTAIRKVFELVQEAVRFAIETIQNLINALKIAYEVVSNIMSMVDNIKSKQALFENLLHVSKGQPGWVSGREQYRDVLTTAFQTRSSAEATSDLYQRILVSGVFDPSTEQANSMRLTKIIQQAMISSGAKQEEAQRGIIQISQALAAGRLQGEDYRSLRSQVPGFMNYIRRGLKKLDPQMFGSGDFVDWNQRGLTTASRIVQALELMSNEIEEDFRNMPITWSQSITRMQVIWDEFMAQLTDNDIFKGIYTAMQNLTNALMSDKMKNFWNTLGKLIQSVAKIVGDFIDIIANNLDRIFSQENINMFLDGLTTIIAMFSYWWALTNAYKILILALISSWVDLDKTAGKSGNAITNMLLKLNDVLWNTVDVLLTIARAIANVIPLIMVAAGGAAILLGNPVLGVGLIAGGFATGVYLDNLIGPWVEKADSARKKATKYLENLDTTLSDWEYSSELAKAMNGDSQAFKMSNKDGAIPTTIENAVKLADDSIRLLKEAAENEILININAQSPVMNNNLNVEGQGMSDDSMIKILNQFDKAYNTYGSINQNALSLAVVN